jgi:hypothetical protein
MLNVDNLPKSVRLQLAAQYGMTTKDEARIAAKKAKADAPARPKKPESSEKQIQSAILKFLSVSPSVAWARRMNSGRFAVSDGYGKRVVQAGFVGLSDIVGQLRDGRFLAVEVKRKGGKVTDAQQAFIDTVCKNGGVGVIAFSVDDVSNAISSKTDR